MMSVSIDEHKNDKQDDSYEKTASQAATPLSTRPSGIQMLGLQAFIILIYEQTPVSEF
jgi:hypothetical protein